MYLEYLFSDLNTYYTNLSYFDYPMVDRWSKNKTRSTAYSFAHYHFGNA